MKQPSSTWRDQFDPGWREREAAARKKILDAVPVKPAPVQPVAWPIETNNQIEVLAKQCGWDNRRYMTPADYQIWCDRMRQFVQLASPPAAQPAPAPIKPIVDPGLDVNQRLAFKLGWKSAEEAHGITEK